MPWLNTTHRFIVELAAILSARMADGSLGVPGMQLLRVTLGKLGATPADRSKVNWTEAEAEEPGSEYFR